jgi:hypothetical protein
MKELLKIVLGMSAIAVCVWLYLKLLTFLDEHGGSAGRYDARAEPSKVEIQSLFHGNTKDQDQI